MANPTVRGRSAPIRRWRNGMGRGIRIRRRVSGAGSRSPWLGLEGTARRAYSLPMADEPNQRVPAGWLEALAESRAQLAAGQIVPGEVVKQHLLDSIARLEAKRAGATKRKAG